MKCNLCNEELIWHDDYTETDIDENEFRKRIEDVRRSMKNDGINIAAGFSWRSSGCSILEQFEEADKEMYADKARFYSEKKHDRRRQR